MIRRAGAVPALDRTAPVLPDASPERAEAPPAIEGRRLRRRLRRTIALLVLAGGGGIGAQAAVDAAAARRSLEEARRMLTVASADPVSSTPSEERLALLDRAETQTEEALRRLSGWPLGAIGRAPILGRDVRVVRSIAMAGEAVLDAARETIIAGQPLTAGRVDGETLGAASEAFLRLGRTLEQAHRTVTEAAPLIVSADGRREFLTAADSARRAAEASARALGLAARFYGPSESVRYFVAFQNPAELRGTGGLIGQYGLLESSPSGPRLVSVEPIAGLQARTKDAVPLPAHVAERYARFGVDRDWTAVNIPPDFPTVGRVIVDLFGRATGIRVDGVVALDPHAAAKVLEASGAIAVDGVRLDATNAAEITMVRAYGRFASDNDARARFLADVARETFAAFVRGLRASPTRMVTALGEAAQGRHVQAYASDPADERAFAALGIAGNTASPRGADYLMPVGVNIAGNKLDAFLRRSIRYEVQLRPDGSALTTASLTLSNEAPPGLPEYVQGPHDQRFRGGENRQFQSLYLAGGYVFTRTTLDGRGAFAEAQRDLGALVLSQEVAVHRGDEVTIAYALRRDGAGQILADRMTYRLLVQPQGTASPDELEIVVSAPTGWRFLRVPLEFRVQGAVAARERFPLVAGRTFEFVLSRSS